MNATMDERGGRPATRKTILGAVCAVTVAAAVWAAPAMAADGSFDRTLKVAEPVSIEVRTGSGNIRVTRGDAATVVVHAEMRSGHGWMGGDGDAEERMREIAKNPPIEQDGSTVRVGFTHDNDLYRNISISYEIRVPAQTRVDGQTGSGNFTASGLQLDVTGRTGSGNVRVEDLAGRVEVTTGSGDIEMRNLRGGARAKAGSGNVQAEGIAGTVRASSGSGSVRVEMSGAGDVEATAGSGNVRVRGVQGALQAGTGSGDVDASGEQHGDWHLHTGSGNVSVELPKAAGFELDAHTGSGNIQTEREITVQGTLSRQTIRGRAGSGGPLLELRTSSGSIYLR